MVCSRALRQLAENSSSSKPAPRVTRSTSKPAACARSWGDATLADLFAAISTTMPQNNPGSLSRDAYAGIVAYHLQRSGHSPGATDLPADPAALKQLQVTPE
jgi:hypothetical protein